MVTGDRSNHLFAEVFPSPRPELASDTGPITQEYHLLARDMTDLGDGHPGNAGWDTLAAGRSEQQFVVFPTVERKLELDCPRRLTHPGERDRFCLQLGSHATFFADVGKIGREAVAGVDHRGSETLLAQVVPQFDSRLGEEMPGVFSGIQLALGLLPHLRNGGRRTAQFSAHIDAVAGPRPRT